MKARFGIPKPPSGTKDISENDVYDVAEFRFANVNVPVPPGYLIPAGTKNISTNGTHDVAEFANAAVAIPYVAWGEEPELVETYDMGTVALSSTGYNNWTPSTTAKNIKATTNLDTFTADMSTYEYFVKTVCEANIAYTSGTTKVFATERQIIVSMQYLYRKPNNLTKMLGRDDSYNYCTTLYTAPWIQYRGSSSNLTMAWTGNVGLYGSVQGHTFSSNSSTSPTVTIKSPIYYAKCNDSYFTTTMASAVDKANSNIKCKLYLYRIKRKGSIMYQMFHDIVTAYNA